MADNFVETHCYDRHCRTCLKSSEEMINIFERKETKELLELLSICTSIHIRENDNFPTKMCLYCFKCIFTFNEFIKLATKVDIKLRSSFKHKETEILQDQEILSRIKDEGLNDRDDNDNIGDDLEQADIIDDFLQPVPISDETVKLEKIEKTKDINENSQIECMKSDEVEANFVDEKKVSAAKTFVCDVCKKSYKSINSLSAHKRCHTDKARILACPVCKKVFKKVTNLKRHEFTHCKDGGYTCMTCSKKFPSEKRYLDHIEKHRNICKICNKVFAYACSLKSHMAAVHGKVRPYLCSICGKRFPFKTNMEHHMKRHLGLKQFACDLCPWKFVTKSDLKEHIKTHMNQKAYSCDKCGNTFTKVSSLNKHYERHLNIRPFECDVCPKKFFSKNHLTRHQLTHTGLKPYTCEFCAKCYKQAGDLERHKVKHLGEKPYKCTECPEKFRLITELRRHVVTHRLQTLKSEDTESIPTSEIAEIAKNIPSKHEKKAIVRK